MRQHFNPIAGATISRTQFYICICICLWSGVVIENYENYLIRIFALPTMHKETGTAAGGAGNWYTNGCQDRKNGAGSGEQEQKDHNMHFPF